MTISASEDLYSGPYACDGIQVVFDYEFTIYADSDLAVSVTLADGTVNELTLTTDYTVTGVGDAGGGTITVLDAADVPDGATLAIEPAIPLSQDRRFSTQSSTTLAEIEKAFDKLTSLARSLQSRLSRTPAHPAGFAADEPLPEPEAGKALIGRPDGKGYKNGPTTDEISGAQAYATYASDSAEAAAASADAAALYTPAYFENEADLINDDKSWPDGKVLNVREQERVYKAQTSGATDFNFTTQAGEKMKRVPRDASPRGRGRIALIFDDGYQNNVTNALPVLKKYGFGGTIAVEVERINKTYNSDPNKPVVTAADMREWIRSGGEICNHPDLDTDETEANMAAAAVAENVLLREILTGEKQWNGSSFVADDKTDPEFDDFRPDMAVYRGGARNDTSDAAYFTVFDKVRGVQGVTATRGDGIYMTTADGEMPQFWSAFTIDPSGDAGAFATMKGQVESVAHGEMTAVMYAHAVIDAADVADWSGTPYILTSELDELCRIAHGAGVDIVPMNKIGRCNLTPNRYFEDVDGGVFSATGGGSDAAEWDTGDTLNSMPRSIKLTASAQRTGGNRPSFQSRAFFAAPFSRYRIRVRYKIGTELDRGGANPNHGVAIKLSTSHSDSAASSDLSTEEFEVTGEAIPYEVTSGYETREVVLYSGIGGRCSVEFALEQCIGTVNIGHVSVEKMDSFSKRPLTVTRNYNTVIATRVDLPQPNNAGSRDWQWQAEILDTPVDDSVGVQVDFAFEDDGDVPSPANGDTCYVLGRGTGAFATFGGQIVTYDGANWGSATTPTANSQIRADNGEGFGNARYWHVRRGSVGGQFERLYNRAIPDWPIVERVNDGTFDIWNKSGTRTDAFTLIARPVLKA